jgi:N-acetylneuraminate synthase/N,N'-diacetyllegionaminate synthase
VRSVKIGRRDISAASPVYFIAEGGVNHNGNVDLAKKLIEEAKKAGADCIKFQTFKAEEIVTATAPKAEYQLASTDPRESQLDMLRKLELPKSSYKDLMRYCAKVGIDFLSTPYNFNDVDFLDEMNVDAFKIASGQLTEYPFLKYVAKKKKPVILSTGMSTLKDVKEAIKTIRAAGLKDVVLLQCTTNYPSLLEDAHLRVISTFQKEFGIPVGYSDHTVGNVAILGAVALGARVIEKHFTLDKKMPGPDHVCSSEPQELSAVIRMIRDLETALGSSDKFLAPIELKNARGMKRSIVSVREIPKGSKIPAEALAFKRPATGLPPKELEKVIGKKALRTIPSDTLLTKDMVSR